MINVYAKNETVFTNNGIATLEPITCDLSMTVNGAWVLNMECPCDTDNKWKELVKGRIIQVTGINVLRNCSTSQRYRIYDTTETLTSIKVIAFPVGMEATYDAVIEYIAKKNRTGNQAVSDLSSYLTAQGVTKYTLTASGLSKSRSYEFRNTNLVAALCGQESSIVSKYNAEVAYNNYQIFVKKNIGSTTDYDVRIGKNLTGLSYEMDDSAVVTRLYPVSQDGIRLNDFGSEVLPHYVQSTQWEEYPHIRATFVDAPYALIDTDIEAEVQTDTIEATSTAYEAVYDYVEGAMGDFWTAVCANNQFVYHGVTTETLPAEPEFIQSFIKDISTSIAETILTSVDHAGLKSWFTKAIRAGIDWIKDEDIPDKNWIENQDHSYSYGNSLRVLTSEWAKIDGKMSFFDSNSKWVKEKDDSYPWDWVQKKGQAKKYGNNKRYCARNTYVYTMSSGGVFSQYWFDSDGWWDGEGEESDWNWYQTGNKWWFGASDAGDNPAKYAHDTWLFIKSSNDPSADSGKPTLYYFDSDGYMVPSLSVVNIPWDWHENKDKWYFGNTNTEYRAEYLSSQWFEIDGSWYYFDSNGYAISPETMISNTMGILLLYLTDAVSSTVTYQQEVLYRLLFQLMTEYCNDLYDDGLDKPLINVSIDFVDLSKTQEYASFSGLETIHLGDSVKVTYNSSGSYVEEEVVGLTYDCLKGCNTQITVGKASKTVSAMFDTSSGGDSGQRLVAGENVTITGNTINVSSSVGDVYAGDTVSVQQLQSTGNAIAKIYVNGIPTTIYALGTTVQVDPIKQSGDKIATITVGGVAYDIYADTGLKWWTETETDIYRTGLRDGISGSDTYLKTSAYMGYGTNTVQPDYEVRKANNNKALIAWVVNANSNYDCYGMYFVSTVNNDANWEWRRLEHPYGGEPYYSAWMEPAEQGQMYSLWDEYASFTYKNATWYVHKCPNAQAYTIPSIQSIPYNSSEQSIVDTAKRIIDLANAEPYTEDIVGISNQDHILYYNDDKKNNYDTENRDDAVYISKEGVFNGTEFRVNGTAIGSFYKTNLYLGTGYSATVGLSDSYTDYDLLLIETYNQDDKKNLASMVNVSDLANASYIGVDGYLMYTITNGRTLTFHEAPSDTNHSRYIKAVYGLRTSHESGTQSPIEDVTVDGASVVSGGVAVIDLSSKQDALTAGNNVQISNQGVISATDTTYSDFAGSAHGLVPPVSTQAGKYLKDDGTWGNPASGSSSISTLTDVNLSSLANGQILKYNSTSQKWENANESGGTDVNVTQTATDSDDADYEILFSGTNDNTTRTEGARKSSGLKYNPDSQMIKMEDNSSETDLYLGGLSIITSDGAIMVDVDSNGGRYYVSGNNKASQMTSSDIVLSGSNNTWDGTHTSLKDAIASAGQGGGSQYRRDTLWTGSITTGLLALQHDVSDYDDLEFIFRETLYTDYNFGRITANKFKSLFQYTANPNGTTTPHYLPHIFGNTGYLRLIMGQDDEHIWVYDGNGLLLTEIAGIKY